MHTNTHAQTDTDTHTCIGSTRESVRRTRSLTRAVRHRKRHYALQADTIHCKPTLSIVQADTNTLQADTIYRWHNCKIITHHIAIRAWHESRAMSYRAISHPAPCHIAPYRATLRRMRWRGTARRSRLGTRMRNRWSLVYIHTCLHIYIYIYIYQDTVFYPA